MKLETIKRNSVETILEHGNIMVTVNEWSNCEGASLMVHGAGKEMPLRLAGAFRWDEIDAIIAALTIARSN